jgi:N utilization substance protein B
MQTYYSILQNNEEEGAEKAWNKLEQSLNKSYELFISIHCLLIQIRDYAQRKIEIKKNKHLPTYADLHPMMRFVENKIFVAIEKNTVINKLLDNFSTNWSDCPEIIKEIWKKTEVSDFYREYMAKTESTIKDDYRVIISMILFFIANNKRIDEYLEDKSIYWNDEIEFVLSNVINDLSKIKSDLRYNLTPIYKKENDELFAKMLITKVIRNTMRFDTIIADTLRHWEVERLAFMDRIILHFALTEIIEIPDMPLAITFNEWIDIAKYYSTNKSSKFLNGLLDKILTKLKEEKQIVK